MRKPKILHYDVETSLMSVYTFGLFKQDIAIDNIIDDWFMICAAWQWDNERTIHSVSVLDDTKRFRNNHKDDYHVISKLYEALKEADIIVGHNADAFDLKKFNARAILHGFAPLPPKRSVDTLKVARRNFKFTSNKLDYITRYLGIGSKMSNPSGLWRRATEGNVKAIKHMVKYNKVDVKELKNIYRKLLPFINNHPNLGLYSDEERPTCPKCGGVHLIKQGTKTTATRVYQQYSCKSCGGWCSSVSSTEKRVYVK